MNLQADLVVLSACETGNGKISPGAGVMGLSWAFFVAGTRSMLVSQWGVNSSSTSELMINFYKDLKVHQADVSGRNAKGPKRFSFDNDQRSPISTFFQLGRFCFTR